MPRVYIVGGPQGQYAQMFKQRGWELAQSVFDCDLVQFTGGHDVTPAIYGEVNTDSGNSERRDIEEAGYFAIARRMGTPMAGICRGGQFLNVMCGGKMIQDIQGHATGRKHIAIEVISLMDGNQEEWIPTEVTSTHHQAMLRNEDNSQLISFSEHDNVQEVIHYKLNRVLCFQPHPEFSIGECQNYYFELIERLFGLK